MPLNEEELIIVGFTTLPLIVMHISSNFDCAVQIEAKDVKNQPILILYVKTRSVLSIP